MNLTTSPPQATALEDYEVAVSFDFKDSADEECEYTFDGCGFMTSDLNKGIIQIDYDFGGMPRRVRYSNGNVARYVYSAAGEKLRVKYQTAVPNITLISP